MLFYIVYFFLDDVGANNLRDCSEIYQAGFILPGVYFVNLGMPIQTKVYCKDGWTRILSRGQFANTIVVGRKKNHRIGINVKH